MSSEIDNGTHLSPNPAAVLSPTWCPPKSPLPPHRLAKLANALGVSTPIPATYSSSPFLSRSFSESASSNDHCRRSPTPSSATSAMGYHAHQPTSKFLLHVVPPHHLPHDSNDPGVLHKTPPPPNAPGYHVHFRRGTLVPVYPTLQAQLGAIAKEYALPSTTGLILYIISTATTNSSSLSPDENDEPGPRLSEDIWKHLWTRVLRIEQRDDLLMPSPAPSPNGRYMPQLLSLKSATRSTPFLPQDISGPLRPFIASPGPDASLQPHAPQPSYTSPSIASSFSDIRSMNKSAPPSSESISPSEPGTPDTSVDDSAIRANSIDLPGLTSPSLIPILAKVEFDIDRRKAGWYAPWIRSRKVNHAKRTENGQRSKSRENNPDDEPGDHVPIELLTGKKKKLRRFSRTSIQDEILEGGDEVAGYAPLPEEIDSDSDSANGEDYSEDATARVSSLTGGKDPLDDVFGTDADTWADIHTTNGRELEFKNPHVVQLALTGAELAALPSQEDFDNDDNVSTKEEDDVRELLDLMSKPNLVISIPSPPKNKRGSSPMGINSGRKNLPPPLVLVPKDKSGGPIVSATASPSPLVPPMLSSNNTNLAYLGKSPPEEDNEPTEEEFNEFTRIRSPEESEKRGGAVFDDLDLGLDPTEEFDDTDPYDRRRSQYLMRAQLDEIERTMAQLSPRILNTDMEDEENMRFSSTLSLNSPGQSSLSPGKPSRPSPSRLPPNPPEPPESPTDFTGQSWPAVPFASIKDSSKSSEGKIDGPPSPPCLAVNGVTTSAPRSYMPSSRPANDAQTETERRKKELEDEQALYPPIPPPKHDKDLSSPSFIPLSPDPFGRYPSMAESSTSVPVGTHWAANATVQSAQSTRPEVASEVSQVQGQDHPTTSRFSADSVTGEELASIAKTSNRTTLISVKSFKKLWRKSDHKKSISSISPMLPTSSTATTPSSGRTSPMAPPRPERPSEEQLDLPDVPDLPPPARLSPKLLSSQPSPREQIHTSRRPSHDHYIALPPSRPSPDQLSPPIQLVHSNQLSVPLHPGKNRNSPTMMTHAQPIKASNLDRIHFDQESPYPVHRSPPVRQSPRPPSPPPLPPIPEQEKPAARKSILKWKSSTTHTTNASVSLASETQPRSSFERPGAAVTSRGRRPSVINFGSTRTSVTSSDLLPPSPQIPEHFVNKNGLDPRQSQRSKLTVSPTEPYSPPPRQSSLGALPSSPPRSSHDSQETRPSLDTSQFEIVSPKSGGSLNYPYHTLDQ